MAERSKAGSLVALEVDLAVVATQKLHLLAQQALLDLGDLQVDQVAFVVGSVAALMVDVAAAATEAASRINQAMAVGEEVLAIKAEEALHPEADTEAEIVVGMVVTRHQMPLLAQEADVAVASPQVGMDVVATETQALPIEMAQHQLDPQHQLEVGMILVAHMMIDLAAVTVAVAVVDMAIVVEIRVLAAAVATWSR